MTFANSFDIAASGLKVQAERIRVVAENIANAGSTATTPGGDPYQRKTITFTQALDRERGVTLVEVSRIGRDPSAFTNRFAPHHPAANADGYVLEPNVNGLIELADMREAQRSYEANLKVMEMTKSMAGRTLEILRA